LKNASRVDSLDKQVYIQMPNKNIIIAIVILTVLSACASAPTQEMSDARQSLQAAYDAGAEKYASSNLNTAEGYLTKAERELELRFYSWARNDAMLAKSEALKAQDVTGAIKAALQAIELSSADETSLTDAKSLIQQALEASESGKGKAAIRLANEARALVQKNHLE